METVAERELRAARAQGQPEFTTSPTRVVSTGLVIPPIRRSGKHRWRLEDNWSFACSLGRITVPRGRETDLADVPAMLRPWINDFQFGITGPLLHDFIYEHAGHLDGRECDPPRQFTRREADQLFWRLMRDEHVPFWRRVLAYASVRVGGSSHWRRAGRQREDRRE